MALRPLIVGNWKMNESVTDSLKLIAGLEYHLKGLYEADVVVAPPFTSLYSVSIAIQETSLLLGAQNVHWEDRGAFTGETSPLFLADLGCRFVIVGHSERRTLFSETDEMINKKVLAVARNAMSPILCVGETLAERERNATFDVIERQLKTDLAGMAPKEVEQLVIAYEPVWAIGTGKTATPGQVAEVHQFIHNLLEKIFDAPTAAQIRILYGGSVTAENSADLMAQKWVDGALVGGASLKADAFAKIVKSGEAAITNKK